MIAADAQSPSASVRGTTDRCRMPARVTFDRRGCGLRRRRRARTGGPARGQAPPRDRLRDKTPRARRGPRSASAPTSSECTSNTLRKVYAALEAPGLRDNAPRLGDGRARARSGRRGHRAPDRRRRARERAQARDADARARGARDPRRCDAEASSACSAPPPARLPRHAAATCSCSTRYVDVERPQRVARDRCSRPTSARVADVGLVTAIDALSSPRCAEAERRGDRLRVAGPDDGQSSATSSGAASS